MHGCSDRALEKAPSITGGSEQEVKATSLLGRLWRFCLKVSAGLLYLDAVRLLEMLENDVVEIGVNVADAARTGHVAAQEDQRVALESYIRTLLLRRKRKSKSKEKDKDKDKSKDKEGVIELRDILLARSVDTGADIFGRLLMQINANSPAGESIDCAYY